VAKGGGGRYVSTFLGNNMCAPWRDISIRPGSNFSTASSVSLFRQARFYKRRKIPWEALQHEPEPLNPKLMPKTAAERDAFLCGAAASPKCAGCKKILPADQFNEKDIRLRSKAPRKKGRKHFYAEPVRREAAPREIRHCTMWPMM
jgi:hypothetical protein